ncbi:type IV pilin biogenesis protein [Tautonia plasticadhaerens]|uniref:Type IV pilin biogenesis protein n=2 Tax=Tautonia plasticadhaerens TaxID=2527974 RepID=A0A518GWR8_9BACT|nr:type IV pilin biogenesis protein [Tautonia plasticadhaerens]
MVFVAAAAIVARLAAMTGLGFIIFLLIIFVLAAIAGAIALAVRGRSARMEPMLWVVAGAVERGLPLEAGIEACGALGGGKMRAKSLAIVRLMEQGMPLAEAFTRIPGAFPRSGLIFLRMGWDGPRLGAALRELTRRRAEWRPFHSSMAMRLAYLAWTIVVVQLVAGFLLYWVAPQLEAIFIDFGVPLPAVSRWVFSGLGSLPIPVGPLYLAVVLLQLVAMPMLTLAFLDPIEWGLWPVDRLLLKRHGATVLRALCGEVSLGRPMPEALARVASAHPSRLVRRRVRKAGARVDRGEPWARSLSAVGLIRRTDAAVLDAAGRAGNLSWALGELADGLDRRSGRRLLAWTQFLFPIAVMAVAVPVVLIALGFFLPLVTLIRSLAS